MLLTNRILNLPNLLSLSRIPLAFLLLSGNTTVRLLAIIFAMITDGLDGYLSRRYRITSQFGAFIDPLTDKFFMLFALTVFTFEGRIQSWQMATLLSRDFAVGIFGMYLAATNRWTNYEVKSIWAGKVSTSLQLLVLLGFALNIVMPVYVYYVFIGLGLLALIELKMQSK